MKKENEITLLFIKRIKTISSEKKNKQTTKIIQLKTE